MNFRRIITTSALSLLLGAPVWAQPGGKAEKKAGPTRPAIRKRGPTLRGEIGPAATRSLKGVGVGRLPKVRSVKGPGTLSPPAVAPSTPPAAPPTPPTTPPPPSAERPDSDRSDDVTLPGEKEFNECIKIPKGRRVKVTLKQESDLVDLVAWISSMTCKKFIVATSLRAQKVTIVSPTPVTPVEAYRAFLSALEVMGLTVAPAGRFLKIVQGNWAIQSSIPTYTDKDQDKVPASDAVVTQIAHVENVDANELLLVLNKMKSRSGDITAYKPTNALIITDNALNVRRMTEILKELDVASEGEKIWVIRLKSADAEEVNKILSQIFGQKTGVSTVRTIAPARGAGGPVEEDVSNLSASKIVADTASNSLIIVASATSFARIASLIKKLDVESEGVNTKINVYYLENGDAESMASTLASLTGASAGGSRTASGRNRPARQPGQPGVAATLFEGDVKISADKPTNSLVIVASPKDYLNLRAVVKKLDIPRRQVFVEASIMEVTLDKNNRFGFAYHGGGKTGEGQSEALIFGGVEHSDWSSLSINPLGLMGLAVGARGQTIDGSGRLLGLSADIPSFGVMFQAMQNNSNVNVLSSPHLLTTDNEQAEITVGQNLPFQGSVMGAGFGNLSSASGTSNLSSFLPALSVQRQDVALKLKLTPHVNDSDMVRLELDQEVSDIVSQNFNGLGPATSKRTAKTVVVVRDQQTVVIGGLMGDRVQDSVSKVPLLGDIPILGYFFKHTTKTIQKTNLLIVLTPYVIRDQSDLRRIFKKKMEERREYIRRFTSFSAHELNQDIDFRHKRGLLSEIGKVGEAAEQEQKMLQESKRKGQDQVTPVEMPRGMSPSTEPSSGVPSGDSNAPVRLAPMEPDHSPPPAPMPAPTPAPR